MEKSTRKRLVLFDAHAIIHRAYHALPDFMTNAGEPTGGLYGLTTMLIKAIGDLKPDYMAACYDLPGPTFRHSQYAAYKAGRAKTDDALITQLKRSREVFIAFNIPIYDAPGFEADDMLGTIVEQTKNIKELEVIIVTGDMDSLQLVSGDKVLVYTLKKGLSDTILYNEERVRERFGFGPELLTDYKGLRGDPSDNIIGIKGIGEKTGGELLTQIGSIDQIYTALAKNKDTVIAKGIKPRIVDLLIAGEDEARFSKMLATIRRDAPITFVLPEFRWREGFQISEAKALMSTLEFRTLGARIEKEFGVVGVVEVQKTEEIVSDDDVLHVGTALWILDSEKVNATKEDILEYAGVENFLTAKEFIFKKLTTEKVLHRVYETIEVPLFSIIQQAKEYGILVDVPYLNKLSSEYHDLLTAVEREIYRDAGEEFNINSPKQLGVILFDKMQLTAKGLKKTEGGARSTRESELEKLQEVSPIIGKILKYREIQKLLSTYIDTIPNMVGTDGRLHSTLHQAGTTTGRMSSSGPNMQNIPVREGYGERIRDAFIAPQGKTLLSFDYSQIELRVLAILSGDPGLTEVFVSGADAHTSVAARVFGVLPNEVTKEMRRKAKVINFGIMYGMGVNALKQNLNSTRQEAQDFYDQYFIVFPKIASYFETLKQQATANGYTETLFGRRRQFTEMRSKVPFIRAGAERMVMNAPIQGTAADMIKIAMSRVDTALRGGDFGNYARLLLQVHDELIYEVDDTEEMVSRVSTVIRREMEGVTHGMDIPRVPLVVDIARGHRWGSLEDIIQQ